MHRGFVRCESAFGASSAFKCQCAVLISPVGERSAVNEALSCRFQRVCLGSVRKIGIIHQCCAVRDDFSRQIQMVVLRGAPPWSQHPCNRQPFIWGYAGSCQGCCSFAAVQFYQIKKRRQRTPCRQLK